MDVCDILCIVGAVCLKKHLRCVKVSDECGSIYSVFIFMVYQMLEKTIHRDLLGGLFYFFYTQLTNSSYMYS